MRTLISTPAATAEWYKSGFLFVWLCMTPCFHVMGYVLQCQCRSNTKIPKRGGTTTSKCQWKSLHKVVFSLGFNCRFHAPGASSVWTDKRHCGLFSQQVYVTLVHIFPPVCYMFRHRHPFWPTSNNDKAEYTQNRQTTEHPVCLRVYTMCSAGLAWSRAPQLACWRLYPCIRLWQGGVCQQEPKWNSVTTGLSQCHNLYSHFSVGFSYMFILGNVSRGVVFRFDAFCFFVCVYPAWSVTHHAAQWYGTLLPSSGQKQCRMGVSQQVARRQVGPMNVLQSSTMPPECVQVAVPFLYL